MLYPNRTMFCPSCGAKNATGALSCSECGRALPAFPGPSQAPAEAPKILTRTPLAPPPNLSAVPPAAPRGPAVPTPLSVAHQASPPSPAAIHVAPTPAAPAAISHAPAMAKAPFTNPEAAREPTGATGAPHDAPHDVPALQRAGPPTTASLTTASLTTASPTSVAIAAASKAAGTTRGATATATAPQTAASGRTTAGAIATRSATLTPKDRAAGVRLTIAPGLRAALGDVIDTILCGATALLVARGILGMLSIKTSVQGLVDQAHADLGTFAGPIAAVLCVVALYHAALPQLLRATPGQRAVGLELVDLRGGRPSTLRLIARGIFVSLTSVLFLIGPSWGFFVDRWRRGLGDLLARTVAVRRR